jgi:hypothetical protein
MKKLAIVALFVVGLICLGTSVQFSDENQISLSSDVEVIDLSFGSSGQPELGTNDREPAEETEFTRLSFGTSGQPELGTNNQEPTEETGFSRLSFGSSGQPELGSSNSENATVTVGFKNSGLPGHVEF